MITKIQDLLNINQFLAEVLMALVIFILSILIEIIIQKFVMKLIKKVSAKTKTDWDDLLFDFRIFHRVFYLVPFLFLYYASPYFDVLGLVLRKVSASAIIFVVLRILDGLLSILNVVYDRVISKTGKSIKGFIQTIKIIMYLVGIILIFSNLAGKSPGVIISGLGAMTAILMLVFKDTIMSFVASIQITSHDLIKVGDWIEAPQFGADGDVTDISLHLITIQNWDKTLVTIPTHKLIDGSFKNWKGMQRSGGRRIKRSILIDVSSIRICDDAMLQRFEKFYYISNYVSKKQKELADFNKKHGIDNSYKINGRRLTNIGIFRAYLNEYIKHNEKIRKDMTIIIRHLQPGPTGLPIEIYVFAKTTNWAEYEDIQSDIFDHIMAVIPEFELKVYQYNFEKNSEIL